jgi:hypothetical protein
MKRILILIPVVLGAALAAGCGGGPAYGRVWITNAVAARPADLLAEFGGAAPVSSTRNPVFGACYGTTTGSSDHYASAGTLELSGTGGPWQLVLDSTDTYRARPSATWTPGTSLTIEASGGEVPPFTGTFIVPPALVYNSVRADLLAAIARDGDVVLSWIPIDAENVWVGVESGSAEVSCAFKGEAGTGTIPGAALATLPASRTMRSVASNSNQLQLGNWWVNLLAQSRAQLADGSLL